MDVLIMQVIGIHQCIVLLFSKVLILTVEIDYL
jgi:hypothetical protein